jgi:glutamyl-tRNA synthetase
MVRTRIQVLPDIEEQVSFFREMPEYDIEMYTNKKSKSTLESSREVITEVLPLLETLESFDNDHRTGYVSLPGYGDKWFVFKK